jgi:hypothetical protein
MCGPRQRTHIHLPLSSLSCLRTVFLCVSAERSSVLSTRLVSASGCVRALPLVRAAGATKALLFFSFPFL